jgi:membrane fusion protein, multidrug efflux system
MVDVITTNKALQPDSRSRDISLGFVRRERRRLAIRYGLIALGAIALIFGGLTYWLSGGRYVTTDDAYVQGNVLNVTTDVSGLVDQILVHEGQMVQQGQVLFRLDPTEFQISIDQAEANLGQTELRLRSLKADYQTAEKQVATQQAKVDLDQTTFNRAAELVTQKAVSRQQYDEAKYQLVADQAALGANQAAGRPIGAGPAGSERGRTGRDDARLQACSRQTGRCSARLSPQHR